MTRFRIAALSCAAVCFLMAATVSYGQEGGGGGQGGGGGAAPPPSAPSVPSTPSPTPTPTPTPTPSPTPTRPTPFPTEQPTRSPTETFPQEMQRPIYISGRVVLNDGTAPPEPVVIERVCNGIARPEGYTDSKGRFSIQLGQNQFVFADASVGPAWGTGMGGSQSGSSSGILNPMGGGVSERDLMGCEIRASLAGYHSDHISLAGRRFMDRPDIGTIVLHRYGNVEGSTISVTAMAAPKDAVKAFDKGRDAIRKSKWEDARKNLEKAVQIYPKYASAWYELGLAYEKLGNTAAAQKAYESSIEADNRYLPPYVQMASLAVQRGNWQEVLDTTNRVLRLDPFNYPSIHLFNAIANFNLKRYEEAEKSVLEALKLDKSRRLPQANHVLGLLLAMRGDFQGAAENMRLYLKLAPNASNAKVVKDQLARVEQMIQAAHNPQAPAQ